MKVSRCRPAYGECKTIVLNRFGGADHNRIPTAPSSHDFFVLLGELTVDFALFQMHFV